MVPYEGLGAVNSLSFNNDVSDVTSDRPSCLKSCAKLKSHVIGDDYIS